MAKDIFNDLDGTNNPFYEPNATNDMFLLSKSLDRNMFFLIDSSMDTSIGDQTSPLKQALYVSYLATRAVQLDDSGTKDNVVSTIVFGDDYKNIVNCSSKHSIDSVQSFYDDMNSYSASSSYLDKAARTMSRVMLHEGAEQQSELVILSNGGIRDREKSVKTLATLQDTYKNVNINIFIIQNNHPHTQADALARELEEKGVKVNLKHIKSEEDLLNSILHIGRSNSDKVPNHRVFSKPSR